MARSTPGAGNNQDFAAGQENYKAQVLFDEHSTSVLSQSFVVDTNFVRVAAFNLGVGEVITIEQITGTGAGAYIADYAPVNGPVTLYFNSATDQRDSYILERPGRYRVRLSGGGLGVVRCFATRFYMENEASQDIADALFAVLKEFKPTPCSIGQEIPNGAFPGNAIGKDGNGCLVDYVVSPPPAPPTACTIGALVPVVSPSPNNYVNKSGLGCLQDSQLVSSDPGNVTVLHLDGVYTPAGTVPTPCTIGQSVPAGNPVQFLGRDSNGCLVWFTFNATNGITINNTTNTVTITNDCFPCGGGSPLVGTLCLTIAPSTLSIDCTAGGDVDLSETTRLNVTSVSGGTAPYTYDWSNVLYTHTWSSGAGTITPTIVGAQLTLVDDNPTFVRSSAPGSYSLSFTPGSYVEITDSAGPPNTLRLYVQSLPSQGSCSSVSTGPGAGQELDALVVCNDIPCTPDSADITLDADYTASGPSAGGNGITSTYSVDNLTPSVCCSGNFQLVGTVSVSITNPLNTGGLGNPYVAPITAHTVIPNILDPGGGPDTDWFASAVVDGSTGTISWPETNPCNPSAGHGPHAAFGHNMTLDAQFNYTIPPAFFSDGAAHTVTITITSAAVQYTLGQYTTLPAPCCSGTGSSDTHDQVIVQNFGP